MRDMTAMSLWRRAFRRIDECPWPGPRPLRGDGDRLVGREVDTRNFTAEVLGHRLVILTGESGVGKSSLLNLGLTRELRTDGFDAFVCNDWTSTTDDLADPEPFIARKLASQLPESVENDLAAGFGLCAALDQSFGATAVLVLDQFEELIRYQLPLFERFVDWIIAINRNHQTRVVLSLRAEYAHRLRRLESNVRPFTIATYPLEPLRDVGAIREVIESANTAERTAIDGEAVDELLRHWVSAGADDPARGSEIGLLDLQAVLYALHQSAGGEASTVQAEHVARMASGPDGRPFASGIREAVALKLERCRDACAVPQLREICDPILVEGTTGVVERAIGHLSSGGYKLVREAWDLARNTMEREFRLLRVSPVMSERTLRALLGLVDTGDEVDDQDLATDFDDAELNIDPKDPLTAPRGAILALVERDTAAGSIGSRHRFGEDRAAQAPWETDPDDRSSGPMLGLPPESILVEEMRRFVFAMEWLREADLVRPSSPQVGQTMLSLVHDGFGPALDAWATARAETPGHALSLITAARGESYEWQDDRGAEPKLEEFDGSAGSKVIANLRWRDCRITAVFREVVFVNCDFRGSRFEKCGFRGTVFVNCLLDGVTFGECTIHGSVDKPSRPYIPNKGDFLPSFEVDVDEQLIATIGRYRTEKATGNILYSPTSGVPALPWSSGDLELLPWEPQSGGLTMYGGRLCSLMVRNCVFRDSGMLAFRHISGSSLDIVEQGGGSIEVFDSAIRGLSITRAVDDVGSGADEAISLRVDGSILAETWFGSEITGRVSFAESRLIHLWNCSAPDLINIHDCGYYGLVNVAEPSESSQLQGIEMDRLDVWISGRKLLEELRARIDYRSIPAKLEFERRARKKVVTTGGTDE